MIRLLIGGALLFALTYVGFGIERFYKERVKLFKEFEAFTEKAAREISFLRTDIVKLTENAAESGTVLGKLMGKIIADIKSGVNPVIDSVYLSKDEAAIITGFFAGLSRCDYAAGDALCGKTLGDVRECLKKSEKQKKERGELIKKLLILLGVGILILIV